MDHRPALETSPLANDVMSALAAFAGALELSTDVLAQVRVCGVGALPSAFPVSGFATGAIGVAGLAVAELLALVGPPPAVTIDRRLASLWFGMTLRPSGWDIPAPWDPVAGDYACADGWIRLHTNAPHHRAAALAVLGCAGERAAVTAAVAGWSGEDLELAVIEAGGCAAVMRSVEQWAVHPQGRAVAQEPLVATGGAAGTHGGADWQPDPARPLAGLRVLDLTRVLAGPIATRFLAGFGAQVLRIDPPDWNEPGVIPEVTPGKHCARLDLRESRQRAIFEHLLAGADVLVHGYRPGALEGLGYGQAARQALRPGLIDVSLDAYGWSGPWQGRRGFDSLVQMSCGIANAGMRWKGADKPVPLPVQALDHATGYLMAAAVVRGVTSRLQGRGGLVARLSLARVAAELIASPVAATTGDWVPATESDYASGSEQTTWGSARRIASPVTIAGRGMTWARGSVDLGSDPPTWPPSAS